MVDSQEDSLEEALESVRKHFSEVTHEEWLENVRKWCPELLEDYYSGCWKERLGS